MARLLTLAALLALAAAARAESPVEAAVQALRKDPSLKVRTQAAIVLGQRGAPEAVPAVPAKAAANISVARRSASSASRKSRASTTRMFVCSRSSWRRAERSSLVG